MATKRFFAGEGEGVRLGIILITSRPVPSCPIPRGPRRLEGTERSGVLKDPLKRVRAFQIEFGSVGSRLSACSFIKLLLSNLFLILSVNNPTHMYLSVVRVYFIVEVYFRVT